MTPRPSFTRPPPERSASSVLWVIVLIALLGWGGYRVWPLFQGWQGSDKVTKSVTAPPSLERQGPYQDAAPKPTPQQPFIDGPQSDAQHHVSKCVLQGKTTYSDSACPTGSVASRVVIDPHGNASQSYRAPPQVLRAISGPAQVPVSTSPAQLVSAPDKNKWACQALNDRVKYLDSLARQANSGSTQDWIREERKKTRDAQFRLPC